MLAPRRRSGWIVTLTLVLAAGAAHAESDRDGSLGFFGDWRARLESDFDSRDAGGVEREDRTRIRARVRAGLRYRPSDRLQFEVRLRSGSDLSQQSAHITLVDLDDNDTGGADFNFDRWYVRGTATGERFWGWIGRNGLPFKRSNEMFWDHDATVVGLAGGFEGTLGDHGRLTLQGGRFSGPAGMRRFSGDIATFQAAFDFTCAGGGLSAGLGVIATEADATDPDASVLLENNGARDYTIGVLSLGGRRSVRGRPMSAGVDLLHNSEDYSPLDPDPITAANFDQTDGVVLSWTWGGTKERGDWLVGYFYASIEKFAIHNSWAQDDWVRWGSAGQTRASGMEGHELRYARGLGNRQNVTVRLFLVEAIDTIEDGGRLRIDYNGRF